MTLKELANLLLELSEKYPTHTVLENNGDYIHNLPIDGIAKVREYTAVQYEDGDINYELPSSAGYPNGPAKSDAIVIDFSHKY